MTLFEKDEYLTRLGKTKQKMAAAGIEVLIVTDPANMNYLTGYDGWSFYVPQMVVVALEVDEPVWIGRGMDASGAKYTSFLSEDNIVGYPDPYVQSPERHPMNFAADVLKQRGWGGHRIGLEMDAYYFSPRGYEALKSELSSAKFLDGNLLVNWVRIEKSAREIEFMRQAGRIVERVMQTAIDTIAPGVRECDAVAEIYRAQMRGTEAFGGDYPAIVPMMPTGEKTSTPHLTWTDAPYGDETAVNLELAACRHRYHSPLARTLYLGSHPPARLSETADIVADGMHAALDAVKPGVMCEQIEGAWRAVISRAGMEKQSRIGYSMGLNYPPDWGEHTASLRPGDKTVLQPNMTFHMILGMWMDDWGFECSESFRVTENGHEIFADVPRKLFLKQ
jgi:Xaa-Pro dipeptidase